MNQLSENLARLRTGHLAPLTEFYAQHRDLFARWARRQFGTAGEDAHRALQEVLLDFYDQAADGRLAGWPTDLRGHIYGAARQLLTATTTNTVTASDAPALPAPEASRRQLLLRTFLRLGPDCRQILQYFYFNNYRFDKLAVKMGYANATVARLQKSDCLRKLHEALDRADAPGSAQLLQYLTDIERAADGQLSATEQDDFDELLVHDAALRQAYLAYEQYGADLRWAVGRETLRQRLEAQNRRAVQRAAAQQRVRRQRRRLQIRWALWSALAAALLIAAVLWLPKLLRPTHSWEEYDVQDPGVPAAAAKGRPLLLETMEQYRGGNYGAALRTLRRIEPTQIGQDTFLYYNGLLLLRQGQPNFAESYFQRVSSSPGSELRGPAAFFLGLSHWQQEERAQAKAALQQAVAEPRNAYRQEAQRALREGGL
ncbi:sigma-70 family RNA polymerase sigma factor [Hymenobacter busanensis]|uniref:Sigma-70 family RNA polymerase sigma factor n=1 Tax=Hymenobacter busanensis TaxID=2607656 RepID=A0A7L4ZZR6_9BACT|nr:sigma-70 family RNA polymerase sigma factor [Hymenobacter busanensis]KAA9333060.1 sigma-70 family RNA polymerase sigma factor [Hymenobacter busanensis]QHJ08265.1 hypothetical protein GUY19_13590 [Hymenobacter busanensis]